MNEQHEKDIADLLHRSGARTEPPDAVRERVYQQALRAFEAAPTAVVGDTPAVSEFFSRNRWYAVAAGLMLVVGTILSWQYLVVLDAPVPSIAYATGGYSVSPHGKGTKELSAGATLSTAASGRLLVVLDEHNSIRLVEHSKVTLQSPQRLFLHAGRLYVDSNGGGNNLQVLTNDVSISKVGTQFSVSLSTEGLSVAVREGKVVVATADRSEPASASSGIGDLLRINSQGATQRDAVATTDDKYWHWTQLSRPEFDLSSHNLYEYLQWAARERGQRFIADNSVVAQLLKQEDGVDFIRAADASDADIEKVLSVTYFTQLRGPAHELRIGQR